MTDVTSMADDSQLLENSNINFMLITLSSFEICSYSLIVSDNDFRLHSDLNDARLAAYYIAQRCLTGVTKTGIIIIFLVQGLHHLNFSTPFTFIFSAVSLSTGPVMNKVLLF